MADVSRDAGWLCRFGLHKWRTTHRFPTHHSWELTTRCTRCGLEKVYVYADN
jgi:hypothetical protein